MTATTPTRLRLAWVDRLRGLAIALMVLDHTLVLVDPTNPLRYSLTRLALPLFMATAAIVHRPLTLRRLAHLAPAVALEVVIGNPTLGTSPGIVTTYTATLVLLHLVRLPPLPLALAGFTAAAILPLPITGYHPGIVLGWFALGTVAGTHVASLGMALPERLTRIGRHPLAWYCGHLVALATIHHLAVTAL